MDMDIVVCTDKNYIMPCGVLMHSICKNNRGNHINFHIVIDDSVSAQERNSINMVVENNDVNYNVFYYPIDGSLFDNFPNLGPDVYISKATYYRLYLTEILPNNIDKVLYLDCDMIVRKDISELWNTDVSDVAIASVIDGMDGRIDLYNRLEYKPSKGYFNAGVLLINLKYWREHNLLKQFLDFIAQHHDRIISHDQDVMNFVLQDSKVSLSLSCNFQESFLYKKEFVTYDYYNYIGEIEKYMHDPMIVHYTISKPWREGCKNPFKSLFFKYKEETQWNNIPIDRISKTWKDYIKMLIYMLKLRKAPLEFTLFKKIDFELN